MGAKREGHPRVTREGFARVSAWLPGSLFLPPYLICSKSGCRCSSLNYFQNERSLGKVIVLYKHS